MTTNSLIILSNIKIYSINYNDFINKIIEDCSIGFNDSDGNEEVIEDEIEHKCNEILNKFIKDNILYDIKDLEIECNVYVDIYNSFSENYKITYNYLDGIHIL